jgi:hypothetical protein
MSDYLYDLSARSLSQGSGVRPQLLSTFEPTPAHAEFKSPVDSESEAVTEANPVESRPPITVTPSKPDSHGEPRTATLPIFPATEEPPPLSLHQTIDVAVVQVPMVQRVSQRSEQAAFDNSQAHAAHSSTPPRESLPVSTPRQVPSIFEPVTPPAAAIPNTGAKPAEVHPERITSATNRSIVPAATARIQNPAVAPASDSLRSADAVIVNDMVESEEQLTGRFAETVIRAVTPAVTPATVFSPSLPPAIPPQPPTIHVTIGRVEVRATPPPAESRPKAMKPAAMSLEAYLERRATGGRR